MSKPDQTLTLDEFAQRLDAPKSTAKNWVRAGMPVLTLGRGRGWPTRLSLRAACEWLAERESWTDNVFVLSAMLNYQERAMSILDGLNKQ